LHGGGALGAYQAGAYEELARQGQLPHWLAGISIGAINAALIVGNPPERRIARLTEFWDTVTAGPPILAPWLAWNMGERSTQNQVYASMAIQFGLPGFFSPRWPPALMQAPGTIGAISFYDTAPLKETLENLVDFDLLNSCATRLSVGAVNVHNGNFAYFDTTKERLDVRHIMASSALPPGFPPIEIDGAWYWDGGLVSNTPLQYVLDQPADTGRLVFQVDVFPSVGPIPGTLAEVVEREKDIRFSSRTRLNTTNELEQHALAQAAFRLCAKLPPEWANDPDVSILKGAAHESAVTVVHLIQRGKAYESESKDYEFSRLSMREHWTEGRADMARTFAHPCWQERVPPRDGVHVFDLTRERHDG
jgi:NTE family protein